MCRLFGLHAGAHVVTAKFWLLDAPDSLAEQSRKNPDGTGLGVFDADGDPIVRKEPVAAWQDSAFATEAQELTGTTFIAHVRYASTGALDIRNTHPFVQDRHIFAHNGVLTGLDVIDRRLRALDADELVAGDTDSERVFALITAGARRAGGDVGAGIVDAVGWLADNVGIYALNVLLSTATDLWALRYPATHELYVLDRRDTHGRPLALRSQRISAASDHLGAVPSVVVASEPMDADTRWRALAPGELLHVTAELAVESRIAFGEPPRHQLRLSDLTGQAAASQHPSRTGQGIR